MILASITEFLEPSSSTKMDRTGWTIRLLVVADSEKMRVVIDYEATMW